MIRAKFVKKLLEANPDANVMVAYNAMIEAKRLARQSRETRYTDNNGCRDVDLSKYDCGCTDTPCAFPSFYTLVLQLLLLCSLELSISRKAESVLPPTS